MLHPLEKHTPNKVGNVYTTLKPDKNLPEEQQYIFTKKKK
jgi:hypothetical protein